MDQEAWSFRCLVISTVALQLVVVTMAGPAKDFVPSLPGQPYSVTFKQYAGYITIDQAEGRKLFYYFVEAENSSSTKPLVLWLNGGPGCSSLIGAFTELGPFYPDKAGNGLHVNSDSWNKVANVLFLESPVGVGFSYSKNTSDYFTDDERTAQDALAFLLGWLAEYPEYNSTDFYLTGESYADEIIALHLQNLSQSWDLVHVISASLLTRVEEANGKCLIAGRHMLSEFFEGHYVPQLAAAILQNNKVSGQVQIPLKGIMVGNPLFDAVIDLEYAPLEFGWGHGMVSDDVHDILVQECNYTAPNRSEACLAAEDTANIQMGYNSDYVDPYDVLADVCLTQGPQGLRLKAMFAGKNSLEDPCIGNELIEYLNRPDVQRAMHAEVRDWEECFNGTFYDDNSIPTPISPILTDLVASNLRVWIYNGDLDTVISVIGTRRVLKILAQKLNWKTTSEYQLWFQGSQVGGWSISWGSVVYATVRGASHMVPASQPARALVLFSSFLAGDKSLPLQPVPLV